MSQMNLEFLRLSDFEKILDTGQTDWMQRFMGCLLYTSDAADE